MIAQVHFRRRASDDAEGAARERAETRIKIMIIIRLIECGATLKVVLVVALF